jgi:hypothetical protein
MACGIVANERECVADQPNTERNPVVRPGASICSRREHKLGIGSWSKIHKRDQDREKASNMPDQKKALKLRQPLREPNVDDYTKHDDAPIYQRTVPSLVFLEILWVVEHCQRLDHGGSEVCRRRRCELPPPKCDPSENPADNSIMLLRCQFCCPAVLRRRCWRHGCIFGEGSAGAKCSDEAEEEAVYQGNLEDPMRSVSRPARMFMDSGKPYRTSIGKDSCERDRVGFPWTRILISVNFMSLAVPNSQVAMTVVVKPKLDKSPNSR